MRLADLLWELCLIRHKPSYKIQFSLYRPLSFQYTSINRQRLINVCPFRQSNKKLLSSFAITSGTKRNSVTVPDTVCIMKNVFSVCLGLWISFCRMWSRKMVVVLLFLCLKGKCLVSIACVADANYRRVNFRLQRRLGFYWKDKERIEFCRIVHHECSAILIIKRQKWILCSPKRSLSWRLVSPMYWRWHLLHSIRYIRFLERQDMESVIFLASLVVKNKV